MLANRSQLPSHGAVRSCGVGQPPIAGRCFFGHSFDWFQFCGPMSCLFCRKTFKFCLNRTFHCRSRRPSSLPFVGFRKKQSFCRWHQCWPLQRHRPRPRYLMLHSRDQPISSNPQPPIASLPHHSRQCQFAIMSRLYQFALKSAQLLDAAQIL
jgi:hypothetical protein